MLNRRRLFAGAAAFAAAGFLHQGAASAAKRGGIDATGLGLRPDAADDQGKAFGRMLREAAARDQPVFLPPGTYVVSGLTLPPRVRLSGVLGATRIVLGGGHLMLARNAEHIELSGLTFDGAMRPVEGEAQGLLDLRDVAHLAIDECRVLACAGNGLVVERAAGRVERCLFSGATDVGLWSVDAAGLTISGNTVSDCGNGGILVHRRQAGEDGTIVTGNRIAGIAARAGGIGQHGNGINAFRAGNVVISGNVVADCAFSAIRANGCDNVQIGGNTCLRSGETALYCEFAFEGAAIANNIVDGAANGIAIVNFNEGGRMATCSGNVVRNLSAAGPYPPEGPGFGTGICAEADTAVTGNVVENAPLYGIQLGWGPYLRNVIVTANIVRKAGTGIAVSVVEGAGATIIADNVIDGTLKGAILGQRWAEPVTADLALTGNAGYAHLTIERNRAS
ncbi:hypothetical protein ATER59S_03740 [Aquamicrobium terrae]